MTYLLSDSAKHLIQLLLKISSDPEFICETMIHSPNDESWRRISEFIENHDDLTKEDIQDYLDQL